MSSTETESTTNLLLAAYLIVGGATLVSMEDSGRFTRVHLDLRTCATSSLAGHATQLADKIEGSDNTMKSWGEVFDYSFLSRVDHEYKRLKKMISARRFGIVHA